METKFLIVGQGLCGTWLSYFLIKAGASVIVVDPGTQKAASSAAAGIMNPVTGKRLVRTWMGETLLPFACDAYEKFGRENENSFLEESTIYSFFRNEEEAALFDEKARTTHEDLLLYDIRPPASGHFNFTFGIGAIHPVWLVDVPAFLETHRRNLIKNGQLLEACFDWSLCEFSSDGVVNKDIKADYVIDCGGAATAGNPWFERLPFALNKGDALIAEIPGLPRDAIYKYSELNIVRWDENQFWIGSGFNRDFSNRLPQPEFRERTEIILKHWLKLPFRITDHIAAIRPATVTRDAFAGMHPYQPRLGILNGMGSKGCSMSPFLAHNLATHLLNGTPLLPQTDISKYRNALR